MFLFFFSMHNCASNVTEWLFLHYWHFPQRNLMWSAIRTWKSLFAHPKEAGDKKGSIGMIMLVLLMPMMALLGNCCAVSWNLGFGCVYVRLMDKKTAGKVSRGTVKIKIPGGELLFFLITEKNIFGMAREAHMLRSRAYFFSGLLYRQSCRSTLACSTCFHFSIPWTRARRPPHGRRRFQRPRASFICDRSWHGGIRFVFAVVASQKQKKQNKKSLGVSGERGEPIRARESSFCGYRVPIQPSGLASPGFRLTPALGN